MATESDASEYYVYTLGMIGKQEDANSIAQQVSEYLDQQAQKLTVENKKEREKILRRWNRLIASTKDYSTAINLLENVRSESLTPDVVTYNTLISLAPNYDSAISWLETMQNEGLQPSVITYNTLISVAPNYDSAISWLETMRNEGLQPSVITYSTLISLAPNYDSAISWLETMQNEGLQPDVITYTNLFRLSITAQSSEELLSWYLAQPYHPEEPIQAAIAGYRKQGQIDQALLLVLNYPHLEAARKVIRGYSDQALSYFQSLYQQHLDLPNVEYAIGIALIELGRPFDARPHLENALLLAKSGARKTALQKILDEMLDEPRISKEIGQILNSE